MVSLDKQFLPTTGEAWTNESQHYDRILNQHDGQRVNSVTRITISRSPFIITITVYHVSTNNTKIEIQP